MVADLLSSQVTTQFKVFILLYALYVVLFFMRYAWWCFDPVGSVSSASNALLRFSCPRRVIALEAPRHLRWVLQGQLRLLGKRSCGKRVFKK